MPDNMMIGVLEDMKTVVGFAPTATPPTAALISLGGIPAVADVKWRCADAHEGVLCLGSGLSSGGLLLVDLSVKPPFLPMWVANPLNMSACVVVVMYKQGSAKYLACGREDGSVELWYYGAKDTLPVTVETSKDEMGMPRLMKEWRKLHESAVTSLAFAPNVLLSAGKDQRLMRTGLTGEEFGRTSVVKVCDHVPRQIVSAMDRYYVAMCDEQGKVYVHWDSFSAGKIWHPVETVNRPVKHLSLSPGGKVLLATSADKIFCVRADAELKLCVTLVEKDLTMAMFSTNGHRLISATANFYRVWKVTEQVIYDFGSSVDKSYKNRLLSSAADDIPMVERKELPPLPRIPSQPPNAEMCQCRVCGTTYKNRREGYRHVRLKHSWFDKTLVKMLIQKQNEVMCAECFQVFPSKQARAEHHLRCRAMADFTAILNQGPWDEKYHPQLIELTRESLRPIHSDALTMDKAAIEKLLQEKKDHLQSSPKGPYGPFCVAVLIGDVLAGFTTISHVHQSVDSFWYMDFLALSSAKALAVMPALLHKAFNQIRPTLQGRQVSRIYTLLHTHSQSLIEQLLRRFNAVMADEKGLTGQDTQYRGFVFADLPWFESR